MTNPIDPSTIGEGDPVVIQDRNKNVARGAVSFDHEGRMMLAAFGIEIPIARWSNQGRDGLGGYAAIKAVKIVGHEPPMDVMPFDVVPKKRFKGSNPT